MVAAALFLSFLVLFVLITILSIPLLGERVGWHRWAAVIVGLTGVLIVLTVILIGIFFVTSADSASVVMGTMSSKGDPTPNKLIVIFWGLYMMGIAIVMLLTGGEDVLTGLQNLTILAALPFCLVLWP